VAERPIELHGENGRLIAIDRLNEISKLAKMGLPRE
jgi:hypothetical protein